MSDVPQQTVAGIGTLEARIERKKFEEKVKHYFEPHWTKRIIKHMKPDVALGVSVGPDASRLINRIMIILIGSMLMGILSTLAWHYAEGGQQNEQILVAIFSISWFIFVSFLFLLFERTRLLHILSFLTLILLCGVVQDNYNKEKTSDTTGGKLLMVTFIIAAMVGFLLMLSFATSRKEEELYELRTELKRKEDEKKAKKIMEAHIDDQLEKERAKLYDELKGSDLSIRKEISDAFIQDVLKKAESGKLLGGGGGGGNTKQKNQKQKKDAIKEALFDDDKET